MGDKRAEATRVPVASAATARPRSGVVPVALSWNQRLGNRDLARLLSPSPRAASGNLPAGSMPVPGNSGGTGDSGLPLQKKCAACEREEKTASIGRNETIQRKCASCEEEEKQRAQRKTGVGRSVSSQGNVAEALRSPSQTLDSGTRHFMESRFGRNFGAVRFHVGTRAAKSAHALNAQAYTVGEHVVFAAGRYQPSTEAGRGLIAHELTHVVQQQNGFRAESGTGADTAEQEALANERNIATNRSITFAAAPARVARKDDAGTTTVQHPPTPPNCTLEQGRTSIDPAARLAAQWLDTSIQKLSRFVAAPANPENRPTSEALQTHFGSADPAIAQRVLARVSLIRRDVDRSRGANEIQTECHDSTDRTCRSSVLAYSAGSSLVFCPAFFSNDLQERAETIVHELAHAIVPDILDRGYSEGERILNPVNHKDILSTTEQLTNAESYGLLVQQLGTGKIPLLSVPDDSFSSSCKDMEPLLRVAIARAQQWNRLSKTAVFLPGAAPIFQQRFGSATFQVQKAALDFLTKAQAGLGTAFEFKCDRDCGARVAVGAEAVDNVGSTMLKGTGIGAGIGGVLGAIASPLLGIGALAGFGLGALIGGFVGLIAGVITGIVQSHNARIRVCPRWAQQDEPTRIETVLAAAYEALGNSSTDSVKYAGLVRALQQFLLPPTLQEIDRDLISARLSLVQARLATLRDKYQKSGDSFARSVTAERQPSVPVRPRPTPQGEDLDPDIAVDQPVRQGQSRLDKIRARRQRTEESVKSIDLAEEIMRLEAEERTLTAQLSRL